MATYLDFENKIEKIQEEIVSAHAIANMDAVQTLQKDLEKETRTGAHRFTSHRKETLPELSGAAGLRGRRLRQIAEYHSNN